MGPKNSASCVCVCVQRCVNLGCSLKSACELDPSQCSAELIRVAESHVSFEEVGTRHREPDRWLRVHCHFSQNKSHFLAFLVNCEKLRSHGCRKISSAETPPTGGFRYKTFCVLELFHVDGCFCLQSLLKKTFVLLHPNSTRCFFACEPVCFVQGHVNAKHFF